MRLIFDPPIHPGEVLREEFLKPLGLTAYAVAKRLNVPRTRIERLAAERTPVTPDTALRLGKLFGTTPEFWLSMQTSYDLTIARNSIRQDIDAISTLDAA